MPRLTSLELDDTNLTRRGVEAFLHTKLPALATLDITHNPLPTGELREEIYYDQGFEVGGAMVDVSFTSEAVRAWFTAAGSRLKIS